MFKRSKSSSAFHNKTRRTGFSQRNLSFEALEDRRLLATFTVTNVSDAPVAMAGDVPGSLRQAIFDANATLGADTISFGGLFTTEQTIQLVDQLTITDSVTVAGPGQNLLTLDAGNGADNAFGTGDGHRIFMIDDGFDFSEFTVSLSGLALTGGDTAAGNDVVDSSGGAIYSRETLTLTNTIVTGNATGHGIYGNTGGSDGGNGGGIHSTGTLTVTGSTISGNATGYGGDGGSAFDPYSFAYFGGNGGAGGGIHSTGDLHVTGSTISGNTTGRGGAGGFSYFDPNDPYAPGYRANSGSGGNGGGILSYGLSTVTSSTISGNSTGLGGYGSFVGGGGGIFNSGSLDVTGSTISNNEAGSNNYGSGDGGGMRNFGSVNLTNTIIANSRGGDFVSYFGATPTGSFNIIEDGSGNLPDTIAQDPRLGPLADNGGPTQTHALLPDSPAVGTGSNALAIDGNGLPLPTDQRGTGFDRIKDGTIDIGSFESDFDGPSLIVDTNSDLVDPLDGLTSLREAISFANLRPGDDTITFSANAFTGGDASLIRLTSGELSIRDELTIDGSMASDLTITGDANGDDITDNENITDVDASGESLLSDNSRVISFTPVTGDLTLQGVTVTGGRTTQDNSNFPNSTHSGGGIRFPSNGTLRLVNSTVSGNSTAGQRADGGGVFANSGDVVLEDSNVSGNRTEQFLARGGGIFAYSGDLSLLNSFVTGNSTAGEAGYGGGISTISGNLTITASSISDNATLGDNSAGGGIFSAPGNITLTNSTVSGNSTEGTFSHGGGIIANSGTVTLFNSTVSNNSISGPQAYGGGIRAQYGDVSLFGSTVSGNAAALGGGIQTYSGNINLTNSTISGNRADGTFGEGGGLWVNNSTVQIINSTITGNVATGEGGGFSLFQSDSDRVLTIRNSIIAGNTDNGTAPDFEAPDNPSTNLVVSHSLIGDNASTTLAATGAGAPDSNGNLVGSTVALISPLLGPLADNGGPTLTHALLPSSPAINAGDPTAVAGNGDTPQFDQNGQSRVQEGRLDIGASEFGAVGPAVLRGDVNQDNAVNFLDISPFISVLSTNVFLAEADVNQDGAVNFLDITPFIGVLSSPSTSQLSFANLLTASSDVSHQANDQISVEFDASPSGPTLLGKDVADAQLSVSDSEPSPLADPGRSQVQDGSDSFILQNEIPVETAQSVSVPLPPSPSTTDSFTQQANPSDLGRRASFSYQSISFQATSDLPTLTVPLSVGDYRTSVFAGGVANNNNGQSLLPNYTRELSLAFAGDVSLDGTVDVVNDAFANGGDLGASEDVSWLGSDFSNDGLADALGVHIAIDTLESSAAIDEAFAQLDL